MFSAVSAKTLAFLTVPILLALLCAYRKNALVELEPAIFDDPTSSGLALIQRNARVIYSTDQEIGASNALQHAASPIILGSSGVQQLDDKNVTREEKHDWYSWRKWIWDNDMWPSSAQLLNNLGVDTHVVAKTPYQQTTLPLGYCVVQEWVPLVELIGVALVVYPFMRYRVSSVEIEEGARSCCMILQFMNFLAFTIVIVDSYKISQMVGGGMVFSGCLIGFFMAGSGLGYVVSWTLLTLYPNLWRSRTFTMQCIGSSFGILGSFIYALVIFLVPLGAGMPDLVSKTLLILGRMFGGFAQGFCSLFNRVLIVRITPPENRVQQSVRYQFCTTLGMGLGPFVAASAMLGVPSGPHAQIIGIQHVGVVGVGTQVISLLCVMGLLPNVSKCVDQVITQDGGQDGVIPEEPPPDPASWEKKRIVLTCITLLALRSYIAAGLESTTSLALELRYHWSAYWVGISVSCTYLVALPVVTAFSYVKDSSTPARIAVGIVIVQLLSTFFLYPFSFLDSGWSLLVSDSFVFPLMALGDGMFIGQMDMFKFPEGTFFNVNNRTLVSGLMTNGISRLLGPAVARWIYSLSGLLGYALQQTGFLLLCLLLFFTIFKTFGQIDPTAELPEADVLKQKISSPRMSQTEKRGG